MALLLAGPAAAEPGPAVATALQAAAAAERAGSQLEVSWEGLVAPVEVRLAGEPDAPWEAARPVVARRAHGRGVTIAAPVSPRPYLLLRDAAGRTIVVAERVLPLAGGQNFRDLGGYPVAGGTIAWGRLYRSGDPSGLTAEDLTYLASLRIETVCDLRSTAERKQAPSRLADVGRVLLARDYALDTAGLGALFAAGTPTAGQARALFTSFYREVPFRFAEDYRAMFRALVEGKAPLAVNCSAGKDRTGVAAALILRVLGADRETIVADYLLSNREFRPKSRAAPAAGDPGLALFARLPPDVVQVLVGVERAFIEAALDAIEARPGGFAAYIEQDLGLTPADVATLRRLYVVPETIARPRVGPP
ncbi:tyrosine-protein phosphatase [Thermaurantiacus sp.]